jgi:predicted dehydrogenase
MKNQKTGSRREFLKDFTVLAGSGLVVPAWLAGCSPKKTENTAKPKDKLGVALVGLGNYSKNQLAPALLECKQCYLAGIATSSPEKAAEWQETYRIPDKNVYNYDNFDQIANNPDIDYVYIVLPNSMHAEFTIRAAKAGKHVLCEKPMAMNAEESRQMIAACNENGVQLAIGYRLHFEPYNLEMMRLAREKVYGEVREVSAGLGFRIGDPTQWRLRKALSGGGPLMDVGIYTIQGACYVYGETPVAVSARELPKTDTEKFAEVEESLEFTLTFPSGRTSQHETSYTIGTNYLKAVAENGFFELTRAYDYGPLSGQTSGGPMDFPHLYEQALHMDHFAECIMKGEPTTITPGEMGLRDMAVIDAVYASAAQGGSTVEILI